MTILTTDSSFILLSQKYSLKHV